MRGTGSLSFKCKNKKGIIPAYAGNSREGIELLLSSRDHPRVCGEQRFVVSVSITM